MAKKNNLNNNNGKEEDGGGSGGGKKQKASSVTVVVLKMELHCEGCAVRVVKTVRALDGVESVRIGDSELNKLTVIGHLDPMELRQKVEEKTKKNVELVSPATKKTNDGDNTTKSAVAGGGDNKNKQQKPPQKDQQPLPDKSKTADKKKEEKKPKELPVTTAVLKVPLHCHGCVRKIHKIVSKTKGYVEMSIDKNKDLVTVKGSIEAKLLAEALHHKLKRAVEIIPAKKDGSDGGEKKGKGGEKKNKGAGGGGNDGDGKGGGEKKVKGGGLNDGGGKEGGKAEAYKMENYGGPIGYPYPQYEYGSGYVDYVHAPQLFSDENPNACTLM